MGHVVQLVASPAAFGFRDRVNCLSDPTEEIVDGRWAVRSLATSGEQSIHRIKSMSWQLFVSRLGAEVDSFRQFPRT